MKFCASKVKETTSVLPLKIKNVYTYPHTFVGLAGMLIILNFALFYLAKTKEVGKEIILQILVIFRIKKKVFLSFCTLFSYIFWSKSRNTCIITSKWYYYYSGSRHVKSMIRPISIPTTYMIFKKKMVKTDIWNLNI